MQNYSKNFVEGVMEINLKGLPFDLDFHPSDSLVATGLINGYLLL